MSLFKKIKANQQKQIQEIKAKQQKRRKEQQKNQYKMVIAKADEYIKNLEQQKKKLSFFDFKKKKELQNKINAVKQQKEEIQRKLNETFAPSVISPCTFQIIKFVIAVLFLVLLIKLYSRLSVFSSINEFYTTRQDTKTFN